MRDFKPTQNAQKRAYYTDRFFQKPQIVHDDLALFPIFEEEVKNLKKSVQVLDSYVMRGDLVVYIHSSENLRALEVMKSFGYDVLSEMSAIDYIEHRSGFEIFYQLLSMKNRTRARIKTFLSLGASIESVSHIYSSANWSEREMYDMFGIHLLNHPYLKRILMPDDWSGYPLRKSYPLQGDEAAQWYEIDKIFGREYRDVIGAENRDPAHIDRYDTTRFARLGHEVAYGEEPSDKTTPIRYQEDGGVIVIEKMTPDSSKELKERK